MMDDESNGLLLFLLFFHPFFSELSPVSGITFVVIFTISGGYREIQSSVPPLLVCAGVFTGIRYLLGGSRVYRKRDAKKGGREGRRGGIDTRAAESERPGTDKWSGNY